MYNTCIYNQIIYKHTDMHTCMCIYIYIYLYKYAYIHVYIYLYLCMYVCMHVCMHVSSIKILYISVVALIDDPTIFWAYRFPVFCAHL